MKKILVLILVLCLTGCYMSYEKKSDGNLEYYTEWLADNGIVNIDTIAEPVGTNLVSDIYKMLNIEVDCVSKNISQYTGTLESTGEAVHVFMPDKVGEPNILLLDLVFDIDLLKSEIDLYNASTESSPFTVDGIEKQTNDVLLDEENIEMQWINYLWRGLTINGVEIDIDEEVIQDFVFTELSSPMIFQIGTYRVTPSIRSYVFLGQGINNNYVFIREDLEHSEIEIIYSYPMSTE